MAIGLLVVLATFFFWPAESNKVVQKTPLQVEFETKFDDWRKNPVNVSELQLALDNKRVKAVGVDAAWVYYTTTDGKKFSARPLGGRDGMLARLEPLSSTNGFELVSISVDTRTAMTKAFDHVSDGVGSLLRVLPFLVPLLVLMLLLEHTRGSGGGGGLLGGSGPELAETPETKFTDVIGAEEAKGQLLQIKQFLLDPAAYTAVGAQPPRGVLLEGPPGTGKTLLARALAGETGVSFIAVDGSYFSSMFYGQGIKRVQGLFEAARKAAPCILFIDEIDGIGQRSSGKTMSAGNSEENRIINKMLVEMDGFAKDSGVIVVGATNHAENLDPAMLRPGRFDRVVQVQLPTVLEREAVYAFYLSKITADPLIDTARLARSSVGMSPADIQSVVNKAATLAADSKAVLVTQSHVDAALETVQLGGEVSSVKNVISEETVRRITFHEVGHALVGHMTGAGRVERISIEPRGGALGVTFITRHVEEPLYAESEMHAQLSMMLGGREAELHVFGNTSSGASDDLKRATSLAASMVGTYGFSEGFGLVSLQGLPREMMGPEVQNKLLQETRDILTKAQKASRQVLIDYNEVLHKIVDVVLVEKTISGKQLEDLLPPVPDKPPVKALALG